MLGETSAGFVGRERELTELRDALDGAEAGRGALFLIVGEPGIGKTRLAGELSARAAARGIAALWGRCWEAEARPPYWPWIQILRPLLRAGVSEPLAAALGPGLAYLAQIIPELRPKMPRTLSVPSPESDLARLQLFDAATAFLAHAAATAPLLIFLEDLHWADLPSLRMLEFVAPELSHSRVLAIGTYREVEARHDPAVAEALSRLVRSARHIPLSGLNEIEVGRFIEMAAGRGAPDAVVRAIHRQTEGNPFFVDEVLRGVRARPGNEWAVSAASGLPISQGLRGAIRQRLAPLPPPARALLDGAAVIGRAFETGLLAALCSEDPVSLGRATDREHDPLISRARPAADPDSGLSVETLLRTLAPVLEHDLIARVPGTPWRYRFAHALVRETIYEDLAPARRVALHRTLAHLLESRQRHSGDEPLSEIAHHFYEAAGGANDTKAVEYATRAGGQAMDMLAYEEAVAQYERALRLVESAETPDLGRQGALSLALGTARARAGQKREATQALQRAAAIARRLPSPALLADAALRLCEVSGLFWTEFGRSDAAAVRILEEALGELGDDQGVRRARVMARLAIELCWTADATRPDALSRDAASLARRAADPATLAHALLGRILCLSGPDHLDTRVPLIDEILALSERTGDREVAVNALMWRIGDAMQRGDQTMLRAGMAALVQHVEALHQPAYRWMIPTVHGHAALLEGRFAEAETLAQDILRDPVRLPNAARVAAALLFLTRRDQGRLGELEAGLQGVVARYPDAGVWRASLALLYAELGRAAEAAAELDDLAGDLSRIRRDLTFPYTMACLAEACTSGGTRATAASLYDALVPYDGRHVVVGPFYTLGPIAYHLGLLAAQLERWVDAERHLEDAARQSEALGARPQLARTLCAQARLCLQRGAPGDREAAPALVERALAIAGPLGMQVLCERLEALRGQSTRGAPPSAEASARLRCEGEYWTLAYAGQVHRLRDSKGLRYLARLLSEPGREFHVLDLAGGAVRDDAADGVRHQADVGAVLDERAKRDFRRRLDALRAELEEADRDDDRGRVAAARSEIEAISAQLASAIGLGGRDRAVGGVAERARSSVTKAIRSAIRSIGANDPELARRLSPTIHTGTFCRYEPLAEAPLRSE